MLSRRNVLVLQKDGTLQAFDRSTGSPAWNEKLELRPGSLVQAGNEVLILKAQHQKRNDYYTAELIDADSGRVSHTLNIQHHDSVFHKLTTPDGRARFLPSDDGRDIYVVYGFFDECVERWDVGQGTMVWQNRIRGSHSPDAFLVSDQGLLIFESDEVSLIARSDGAARHFLVDKDRRFRPLAARDGVVVVYAAPTWDSQQKTLLGVDAASGKQLWSAALPKHKSPVDADYAVGLTRQGLAILQVLADKQIALDLLDLKTGVSPGRKIVQTDAEPRRLRIADDGSAWVKTRGEIGSLDLQTGKLAYRLPY
jgi:outer membrane protein assembly factor BamB